MADRENPDLEFEENCFEEWKKYLFKRSH